jgi:hypothetical protein
VTAALPHESSVPARDSVCQPAFGSGASFVEHRLPQYNPISPQTPLYELGLGPTLVLILDGGKHRNETRVGPCPNCKGSE